MKRRFGEDTRISLSYFILHPSAFILIQRQRIVLHVPQRAHVLDPLAGELDVPDEHRAARVQPFLVGDAHDAEPVIPAALADADAAADARGEDFPPAAGDRAQAGAVEAAD